MMKGIILPLDLSVYFHIIMKCIETNGCRRVRKTYENKKRQYNLQSM